MACGILVPQPETEPGPSAVRAQSPNHWTTRELPVIIFKLLLIKHKFWVTDRHSHSGLSDSGSIDLPSPAVEKPVFSLLCIHFKVPLLHINLCFLPSFMNHF